MKRHYDNKRGLIDSFESYINVILTKILSLQCGYCMFDAISSNITAYSNVIQYHISANMCMNQYIIKNHQTDD